MTVSPSVQELVATAQIAATASEESILAAQKAIEAGDATDESAEELRAATVALEVTAIDVFSAFESRMQHHFRRGPFARKLQALLLEAGEIELADRFYQHYLAINVLKHGKGASYRELAADLNSLFTVKQADIAPEEDDVSSPAGLIDVTVPGFFDTLSLTILQAYELLENRS